MKTECFNSLDPVCGRFCYIRLLLKKIFVLPFAVFAKVLGTACKVLGSLLGLALVVGTVGISLSAREFFVSQVVALATDIAHWVLFPFAVVRDLVILLLGIVSPSICYRF